MIILLLLILGSLVSGFKRPFHFPKYKVRVFSPNSTSFDVRKYYIDEPNGVGVSLIDRNEYQILLYRPKDLPIGEGFYVVTTPKHVFCSLTELTLRDIDILGVVDRDVLAYNGTKNFQGKQADYWELISYEFPTYYFEESSTNTPIAIQKGEHFFELFDEFSTDFDPNLLIPPRQCYDGLSKD